MLAFKIIPCTYLNEIQSELYDIIQIHSDTSIEGWQFLNKQLLKDSPSTIKLLKSLNLIVRDFSITILHDDLKQHVDALPQIAKINIPVKNSVGWTNTWYKITDLQMSQAPVVEVFGDTHEDISKLDLPELVSIQDLNDIIVFNSRIPHSVKKNNPVELPRIFCSLTFVNQPMEMLNENSNNGS